MDTSVRRKIVAAAAAVLAVGGAGAAIAATQFKHSPSQESKAVVSDAAKQLGVQPSELSSALKKALKDRVDAAVADKRLTKEQGDALKKRIDSDEFPLVAAPGLGFGFRGHFGFRDTASATTGSPACPRRRSTSASPRASSASKLESGKSLADVAKAQDKSVAGLVSDAQGRPAEEAGQGRLRGQADEGAGGPDHGRRRADDHRRRQRQVPRPAAERQGLVPRAPRLRPGHAGRSTAGRPGMDA